MEYHVLGKTGLKVSMMGLGGIPIQRIDAAGTRILIEKLVENGINYIDTARGYSVSEQYLGEALDGLRDKFILATKSMALTKDNMAKDLANRSDLSFFILKTTSLTAFSVSPVIISSFSLFRTIIKKPPFSLLCTLYVNAFGHLNNLFCELPLDIGGLKTYNLNYKTGD